MRWYDARMSLPFDTGAEDEKLAEVRAAEEEDLARILSEKHGMGYVNLAGSPIDADALRLIPEAQARSTEALAFKKDSKHIAVAVKNPENPALAPLMKDLNERGFSVDQYLVSKRSFEKAMERYKELSMATASREGVLIIPASELEALQARLGSVAALGDYLTATVADKKSAAEVTELINGIFASAFALHASDIHIEPEETGVRLRLRLDGELTDAFTFDPHMYHFVNSRLKLLSGMKLNIRDRAQDGRFTVDVGGTEVDVRASLIPGNYGESFVMRMLDPHSIQIDLSSFGIHPKLLSRLEAEIKRPNGMLLTTGPTGSGKTTMLYALLRRVQTPEVKIITIEDPVEYRLAGIVQTQVEKDYTFASGLRSIVRQDPDVIMVGEIRDAETAGIAIQAALTGHFVFSTLHTNDAAGTFPRLTDLGADPKEFASSVTVAMAQRLVRTLDPDMKKQVPMTAEHKALVDKVLATVVDKSLIPPVTDMEWVPDPKDGVSGYKGRVGLYEAIFMDDELGAFLRDNPSASDIRKQAAHQGYLTMVQDGVVKALAGLTSLEEVFSVADIPRD